MAWSDAARKAAADKKAMGSPAGGGAVPITAPVKPQNPRMNRVMAAHARGFFRHKMPK